MHVRRQMTPQVSRLQVRGSVHQRVASSRSRGKNRARRELVAKKYDGSQKRGPGRPPQPNKIVQLLIKMAEENPRWGYTRLRGALRNVGCDVGRNTVASLAGLIRYHVFFFIDIASRKVEIAGITSRPEGRWMDQIARNLLDVEDGFLLGKRYLLLDRDPLYTKAFRTALEKGGTTVVRLPPRSPDLNAFAERFVLSIKTECLDRIVPLGERHLRRAVSEFVAHYHQERNHQGLKNQLIETAPEPANTNGRIVRRERLGGLLNFYSRTAA